MRNFIISVGRILKFTALILQQFRPRSEEMNKLKGTVKWYNARKGYGFIQGEDGKDVFVHQSALPMGLSLNEGDQVEFSVEQSDRGPKAAKVKKL